MSRMSQNREETKTTPGWDPRPPRGGESSAARRRSLGPGSGDCIPGPVIVSRVFSLRIGRQTLVAMQSW